MEKPKSAGSDRQGTLTLTGFLGAFVVAAALVGATYWMSVRERQAQAWIVRTHEVLAAIGQARANAIDVQNGLRGFVLTGRQEELALYESARRQVQGDLQRLRELVHGNPVQDATLREMEAALAARQRIEETLVEARRTRGPAAASELIEGGLGRGEMLQVRDLLQRMESEESRLLSQRWTAHQQGLAAFWVGMALLLMTLFAALLFVYQQFRSKREAEQRLLEGEQQFHAMADSVTEYAIVLLDADGMVRTWNPGARRIEGYEDCEILGAHFSRFYLPQDAAAGGPQRALRAAASEGRYSEEGWRVRKDGTRFWATVDLSPVRDAEGRVTGYCKITRDLTDRKRAEEALRAEVQERGRAESELQHVNTHLKMLVAERTLALQQANEALTGAKERLQALSARLISAQEEERRHIARELHDETGQALTLVRMQLSELAGAAPSGQVRECMQAVDRAITHIRGLSLRLRPPMLDDLGLVDALEWVAEQQARSAGWRLHLALPEPGDRLPEEVETACFRICQEALTNAARYAHAGEVTVSLRLSPATVELQVADDGTGFDLARYRTPEECREHFGLVSMSERAVLAGGRLDIVTTPGQGTLVRAQFPLAGQGRDNPASAPGELFA